MKRSSTIWTIIAVAAVFCIASFGILAYTLSVLLSPFVLIEHPKIVKANTTPEPGNDSPGEISHFKGKTNVVKLNKDWAIYKNENITWDDPNQPSLSDVEFYFFHQPFADRDGNIWFPSDGNGIFVLREGALANWLPKSTNTISNAFRGTTIIGNDIYAILSGSDTGVMASFDSKNQTWEIPWSRNSQIIGKPSSYQIASSDTGNLYVGSTTYSNAYLNIYQDTHWTYEVMPCKGSFGRSIYLDRDNSLWVIDGSVLCQRKGNNWAKYTFKNLPIGEIYTLDFDSYGDLWAGTENGLLIKDLNEKWYFIPSKQLPFDNSLIVDIAFDKESRVWFLCQDKLAVYNGNDWQIFRADAIGVELKLYPWAQMDPMNFINGDLWIASDFSVLKFSGNSTLSPFIGKINLLEQNQPAKVMDFGQ
jgi:hypothetical protein